MNTGGGDIISTQNLSDDEIRRMRKAEIMQHLKMHGIEPNGGKGEMKGQLRVLRDALLTGSRPSVLMAMPGITATTATAASAAIAPGPVGIAPATPMAAGVGLADGYDDEYGVVLLGGGGAAARVGGEKCAECNRKGNKLCPYKRCRACCAAYTRANGFACPIHYKGNAALSALGAANTAAVVGAASGGVMVIGSNINSAGSSSSGNTSSSGGGRSGRHGPMYGVTVKSERPFPSGGSGRGRRGHGGSSGHSYSGKNGGSGGGVGGAGVADSGLHSNGRRVAAQRGPWLSAFHRLCKHVNIYT